MTGNGGGGMSIYRNYRQGGCFCVTCEKIIPKQQLDSLTFKSTNNSIHCIACGRTVRTRAKGTRENMIFREQTFKRIV